MKDLKFFEKYFSTCLIIWIVSCVLAMLAVGYLSYVMNSVNIAVLGVGLILIVLGVGYINIKFQRIFCTRFVAATENIYEITVMMEEDRNKDKKAEEEKKRKAEIEGKILSMEAELAKAKEEYDKLCK